MSESNNIFVLTGAVKTGKTSSLIKWASDKDNIHGIAQPVINGTRYVLDFYSKEHRRLEVESGEEDYVQIGNYMFSKRTFEWAKICLLFSAKQKPGWLIIDEVGKLELNDMGLEPVITYLIDDYILNKKYNLLFVVRDYLLKPFIQRYNLDNENPKLIYSLDDL